MKFIITEDALKRLSTIGYRGVIGFFWNNTLGGILAYVLCILIMILSIVGAFTILKWLVGGKKRKMDPHEKWLKTGKMD